MKRSCIVLAVMKALRANPPELPAIARLTLSVLADFADARGECFPSLATIGPSLGRSSRTAQSAVQLLARTGWLEVRRGGGVDRAPNHYRLNVDRIEAAAAAALAAAAAKRKTPSDRSPLAEQKPPSDREPLADTKPASDREHADRKLAAPRSEAGVRCRSEAGFRGRSHLKVPSEGPPPPGGEADASPARTKPEALTLEAPVAPARQLKPARSSTAAGAKIALSLGWETYGSARARRYPGAYVRTAPDGPAMVAITKAARANVEAYGVEHERRLGRKAAAPEDLERDWLAVFWRRYFALEGRQGELVRLGHPVRCAQRELNGLGFPDGWRRMLAVGGARGRANGMTNGGTAEEPVRSDPPEVLLAAARRARVAREPATEVAS